MGKAAGGGGSCPCLARARGEVTEREGPPAIRGPRELMMQRQTGRVRLTHQRRKASDHDIAGPPRLDMVLWRAGRRANAAQLTCWLLLLHGWSLLAAVGASHGRILDGRGHPSAYPPSQNTLENERNQRPDKRLRNLD